MAKKIEADHSEQISVKTNADKTLYCYSQRLILLSALFVACCLLVILWGKVPSIALAGWFLVLFAILAINLAESLSNKKTRQQTKAEHRRSTLINFAIVSFFSIIPLFLWPPESQLIQLYLALCFTFLSIIMMFSSLISKPPTELAGSAGLRQQQYLTGYLLILLGPLLIRLILEDGEAHYMAAILLFFVTVFILLLEASFRQYFASIIGEYPLPSRNEIPSVQTTSPNISYPNFSNPNFSYPGKSTAVNLATHVPNQINTPITTFINTRMSSQAAKRILVIDDNLINQQVAREMLEGIGLQVDLADNGKDALDKIFLAPYDLLLMDIQMPEMDGFEATRKIRDTKEFKNLPIVAMTAYALPEDKEKCLACGMNDHTSKPLEPDDLYETLAKWLGYPSNISASKVTQSGQQFNANSLPALPGIDKNKGLGKVLFNGPLYLKLLENFYHDYHAAYADLQEYLRSAQWDMAQVLLHSLKGTSGNIAAMPLFHAVIELEQLVLEKKHDDKALNNFSNAFNELMQGLEKLSTPKPNNPQTIEPSAPIDYVALQPLLGELADYLHAASPQAVDLLPNIKFAAKGHLQDLFSRLTEYVYTFQFEKAVLILEQINQKLKQMENAVGG